MESPRQGRQAGSGWLVRAPRAAALIAAVAILVAACGAPATPTQEPAAAPSAAAEPAGSPVAAGSPAVDRMAATKGSAICVADLHLGKTIYAYQATGIVKTSADASRFQAIPGGKKSCVTGTDSCEIGGETRDVCVWVRVGDGRNFLGFSADNPGIGKPDMKVFIPFSWGDYVNYGSVGDKTEFSDNDADTNKITIERMADSADYKEFEVRVAPRQ